MITITKVNYELDYDKVPRMEYCTLRRIHRLLYSTSITISILFIGEDGKKSTHSETCKFELDNPWYKNKSEKEQMGELLNYSDNGFKQLFWEIRQGLYNGEIKFDIKKEK